MNELERETFDTGPSEPVTTLSRTRVGLPPPSVPADGRATRVDLPYHRATAMRLGPGVTLPGTSYRVESWIGDGAMGVVYRAVHIELERAVALKILRPEACGSPQLAQMIRQEAKNASRVGSNFIAEVYDLGELPDGRVWFTMPLLDGASLRDVAIDGPLEPGRAIGIFRQIAKALAAAHDKDLIHRDVKPENVMLVRHQGRADAVRVLDWGVAAIRDDAEQGRGSVAGTPYYIAPELLLRLPYDHRVDIYSFGCMAFELLTGLPPFREEGLQALMSAHIEDEPPAMADMGSARIPASLERVVRACLAKHPQDRLATAVELEARLCEAQIEAKLASGWDDLPLPEVDADRRARLASGMPDPLQAAIGRTRWRWGLGLVAVVFVVLLAWWARGPAPASTTSDGHVETLATSAHQAAAKALFVYPPADAGDARTAYMHVRALEALDEPAATDRANQLREEFANTLAWLGDRYWSRPGGRGFAMDYYVEALIFVPGLPQATERVGIGPGELAVLRARADAGDFSKQELAAVQPLIALAQQDPAERDRQLEALSQSATVRPSTVARLEQLAEADEEVSRARSRRRARRAAAASAAAVVAPPVVDAEPDPEVVDDTGTDGEETDGDEDTATAPAEARVTTPTRDRKAAAALSARADAAFRSGQHDRAEALYQQALVADDRNAAAHAGNSRIAFHRGHYADAARHGEQAVRRAPRSGKYRVILGEAYYKAYRYEKAIEQFDQAAQLGYPGAQTRLDKARAKAG